MKKKYTVDVIGGTISSESRDSFSILTTDFFVYRVESSDKKLFSLNPEIGEVVWIYRIKSLCKVIDMVFYDENPDLEIESYEIEMEEK